MMRKNLNGLILLTVICLSGCAAGERTRISDTPPPERGDFRGMVWGMEQEAVAAMIPGDTYVVSCTPDRLVIRERILDRFVAEAAYHFSDGRLNRGSYRVGDPEGVIDYTIFRMVLEGAYGPVYSEVAAPEIVETVWLTPRTEIDLSGSGRDLEGYTFLHPEGSRGARLDRIKVNYYDREYFARERKKTVRAEAALAESEELYQKLIGDWVQVYPDYRSYLERAVMLQPGGTYLYEPEYYDPF